MGKLRHTHTLSYKRIQLRVTIKETIDATYLLALKRKTNIGFLKFGG